MNQPTPKPCRLGCGTDVLVAKKARNRPGRSGFVVLDARPLNSNRQHDGRVVRVLDGWTAYTIGHMRESLELRSAVLAKPSDATNINDLPWHRLHDCPNHTTTKEN